MPIKRTKSVCRFAAYSVATLSMGLSLHGALAQEFTPGSSIAGAISPEMGRELISSLKATDGSHSRALLYTGNFFFSIKDVIFTTDKIYFSKALIFRGTEMNAAGYVQIDLFKAQPDFKTQDVNDCMVSAPPCAKRSVTLVAPYGANQNMFLQPFILIDGRDKQDAIVTALTVLHQAAGAVSPDEEARFNQIVSAHRISQSSAIPEGVRRFQIEAEDAVRAKDFVAAENLYAQGIEIAPWWADGYYNRALVLGEIEDYPQAIIDMQRYLALSPDASDARAVQDKIYTWQRKVP